MKKFRESVSDTASDGIGYLMWGFIFVCFAGGGTALAILASFAVGFVSTLLIR